MGFPSKYCSVAVLLYSSSRGGRALGFRSVVGERRVVLVGLQSPFWNSLTAAFFLGWKLFIVISSVHSGWGPQGSCVAE